MNLLNEWLVRARRWLQSWSPPPAPVTVTDGTVHLTVQIQKGKLHVEPATQRASHWVCLPPCAAPARMLSSTLGSRPLRLALAFLMEPQIPLPIDHVLLAGARVDQEKSSDVAVAYLPSDRLQPARCEGMTASSMAITALPFVLGEPPHGLWGFAWGTQGVVSCWRDGRLEAIRVLHLDDRSRIQLLIKEFGEQLPCTWLGGSGPSRFQRLDLPQLGEHVGLALCGLMVLRQRHLADLIPPSLPRTLARRTSRKLAWCGAGVVWCGLLLSIGWLRMEVQSREEMAGVAREEIPALTQKLLDQAREAQVPFAPEPTLPRAHEVLAWLASLSELQQAPGLQIEKFRYLISQFPTAGHERDAYTGRITLEFRVKEAFAARKILERISAPNASLADVKQPIEWSHHAGLYRLSFTMAPKKAPGKL
ncbi:MAG: hypothetical protein ACOYKZ_04700 [Chlamydiia bacterium]